MSEIVKWSGHGGIAFYVKGDEIRSVRDLSISVSAETEDKISGGEKFTGKKNSGGYQMTMTALLSVALGTEDVQKAALAIAEAARVGDSGYLYCHDAKLIPANMMMTDAKINKVTMTQKEWFSCEVSMTLKQCSKYGTEADDGSGKKKKKKKKSKGGGTSIGFWEPIQSAVKNKVVNAIPAAKDAMNTTNSAKQRSQDVRNSARSKAENYKRAKQYSRPRG